MTSRPRDVAISFVSSGLLHVGAVAGVLVWYVSLLERPDWSSIDTAVSQSSSDVDWDDAAGREITTDVDESPAIAAVGSDVLAVVDPAGTSIAALARQKLKQESAEVAEKTVAERMTELETLGRQLNSVSSQESITEMTEAIAPWLGSAARATEPAPETEDAPPFDIDTSQIYDVRRSGEEGAYQYTALLLDAAGQTREIVYEQADGEEFYKRFQLMKKFPLMETVYRKTVLGLFDTMMIEERAESFSAPESSEESKQAASDQSDQDQD